MRIVMLSHGYPPTVSGVTLVVQKVSRTLVKRGHSVAVITGSERQQAYREEDEGVQLFRVRSKSNPFWKEGPIPFIDSTELQEIIAEFDPDLIHTHENAILTRQLLRLKHKKKVPMLLSCYFLPRYVTQYLRWGSTLERLIQDAIWKYTINSFNQFDHVIFSTLSQQREYLEHDLSVPTTVISNGVDTRRYFPLNGLVEDFEARYRLPSRPRILFVGRLMKDKKIDLLIQAMSHVCAELEAHLLVVGRGDEQSRLEKLARDLHLEAHVHLLGFIPEQDLPGLYRASDIFAIASVCEVQSIPALQAAVTGLPMVGVEAAALPEVIQDEINGMLVPPDDPQAIAEAILRILCDRQLAYRMGQASLSIGEAHSELETFRKFENLYQELIAGQ